MSNTETQGLSDHESVLKKALEFLPTSNFRSILQTQISSLSETNVNKFQTNLSIELLQSMIDEKKRKEESKERIRNVINFEGYKTKLNRELKVLLDHVKKYKRECIKEQEEMMKSLASNVLEWLTILFKVAIEDGNDLYLVYECLLFLGQLSDQFDINEAGTRAYFEPCYNLSPFRNSKKFIVYQSNTPLYIHEIVGLMIRDVLLTAIRVDDEQALNSLLVDFIKLPIQVQILHFIDCVGMSTKYKWLCNSREMRAAIPKLKLAIREARFQYFEEDPRPETYIYLVEESIRNKNKLLSILRTYLFQLNSQIKPNISRNAYFLASYAFRAESDCQSLLKVLNSLVEPAGRQLPWISQLQREIMRYLIQFDPSSRPLMKSIIINRIKVSCDEIWKEIFQYFPDIKKALERLAKHFKLKKIPFRVDPDGVGLQDYDKRRDIIGKFVSEASGKPPKVFTPIKTQDELRERMIKLMERKAATTLPDGRPILDGYESDEEEEIHGGTGLKLGEELNAWLQLVKEWPSREERFTFYKRGNDTETSGIFMDVTGVAQFFAERCDYNYDHSIKTIHLAYAIRVYYSNFSNDMKGSKVIIENKPFF